MLAVVLGLGSGGAPASTPSTPEQVVLDHARAWSSGDLPGLLALFADDGRSYKRPTDPHRLAGELSETIGTKAQLETYFEQAVSRGPTAREQVGAMAVVGDLVIAAGESAQPPDFATRMQFLTGYRVRNGQIRDLWHIAWRDAESAGAADAAEVVRQLIGARNAGDAERIRTLLDPAARHFRYSDDPRTLAEQPIEPRTDAIGRETESPYFSGTYFGDSPVRMDIVQLFSVGDLVVEQARVTGRIGDADAAVNQVSVYRIRDGRIVTSWLLGEEALEMPARGAAR